MFQSADKLLDESFGDLVHHASSRFGMGHSVITLVVVMRPILLPANSVNESAPCGPAAILELEPVPEGVGNSVSSTNVPDCATALPQDTNNNAVVQNAFAVTLKALA